MSSPVDEMTPDQIRALVDQHTFNGMPALTFKDPSVRAILDLSPLNLADIGRFLRATGVLPNLETRMEVEVGAAIRLLLAMHDVNRRAGSGDAWDESFKRLAKRLSNNLLNATPANSWKIADCVIDGCRAVDTMCIPVKRNTGRRVWVCRSCATERDLKPGDHI